MSDYNNIPIYSFMNIPYIIKDRRQDCEKIPTFEECKEAVTQLISEKSLPYKFVDDASLFGSDCFMIMRLETVIFILKKKSPKNIKKK